MADSPCVRNCCLDQQDICLGCGRSVDEITEWHSASPMRRAQIVKLAQLRSLQRDNLAIFMHHAADPSE